MQPLDANDISAEFASFLASARPELEIIEVRPDSVVLDVPDMGRTTLMLHRLHGALGQCDDFSPQTRRVEYEKFVELLLPHEREPISDVLEAPDVSERVLPKLVRDDFLETVRRQTGARDAVPHRVWGETGLLLVYVIDFPDRVAYILRQQMQDMGLDRDTLHETALRNARELFGLAEWRELWDGASDSVQVAMCGDGHNSARAVLIAEYLQDDEAAVVILPDRDALIVTAYGPDNNVEALRELARDLAGQSATPFLPQPLLLTAEGARAL